MMDRDKNYIKQSKGRQKKDKGRKEETNKQKHDIIIFLCKF